MTPDTNSTTTTTTDTTGNRPSASRTTSKRPARESSLVVSCMESKIRRLREAGADANVMDTAIRANPKRYLRYAQVPAKYLCWCQDSSWDSTQPSSLLNFLVLEHPNAGWPSTHS